MSHLKFVVSAIASGAILLFIIGIAIPMLISAKSTIAALIGFMLITGVLLTGGRLLYCAYQKSKVEPKETENE